MKYPKHIYVYLCDYDNQVPIYAVAATLDEIDEGRHGELIASYAFVEMARLTVSKTILSSKKK